MYKIPPGGGGGSIASSRPSSTILFFSMPFLVCADPGRGGGSGPPLKNLKNIEFFSKPGPDPPKITKLPSQHSMLGHHPQDYETPFKWRFAGGSMMARL